MRHKEKPEEAFVERPQEENQPSRASRISLHVSEDGTIDWSQATDAQKQAFIQTVTHDPETLEMIGSAVGDEETPEGFVTPAHMKIFLEGYAGAERAAIPWLIEQKSKGLIKIPKEVAKEIYSFTEEEKESIAPDGAKFVNEELMPNLPDWFKEWLFAFGPGAKFLAALAIHTSMKTITLIDYIKQQPQTVDANQGATPINREKVN